MSKLRFGVCGLGFMGRAHLQRIIQHPDAELVAVCDRDAQRRRSDFKAPGNIDLGDVTGGAVDWDQVRGYDEAADLIRDDDVDVVLVALPTRLHAEVAIAAMEAGKHVLTEKPMAYKPGECQRMLDAAEDTGRTLMVAQCLRFWPQYETIKQCIDEGRLGRVQFAVLRRLASPPAHSQGNWLLDGSQSGGAVLDMHIHDVDFAHYLFGVPDRISALGTPGATGGLDHIMVNYAYDSGLYVTLEGGWALTPPWPFDMAITVHGDRATVDWAMSRGDEVRLFTGGAEPELLKPKGDALARELDYFIDCVRQGVPVDRCSPVSTRISVVLAWLERRAVETARAIEVTDQLRRAWGATEDSRTTAAGG